ncbi:MAG: hypothetical protein NXI24_05020 [bacterium]|nr:hypothetical protein [bacterium]
MVLDFRKIRERGLNLRLLWDLFMIFIAVINVLLIVFDWSYFYARPYLFQYAPALTRAYDPIKAVEDDAQTTAYLELSEKFFASSGAPEREALAGELVELSREMAADNPLTESGQSVNLYRAARSLANFMAVGESRQSGDAAAQETAEDLLLNLPRPGELRGDRTFETVPAFAAAAEAFWSAGFTGDVDSQDAEQFFETEIRPLFEVNFNRRRGLDGSYEDYFLLIDGPFLILFFIEFMARWFLAIRRRELVRWWLFPVYNWYDVLGLIPFAEFRVFRLFRVLSIYVRLHRSDLTSIGDDFVSRTIKRYSAILTEEVSDRVAARILTEMQDEIQRGASIDIFLNALEPRREAIKKLIVGNVRRFAERRPGEPTTRELLAVSLEEAARNVPSLQLVPDFVKERLTREIGVAVFDGINATLAQAVQGERGEEIVGEIVDMVMDDVLREGQGSPVDELYRAISMDVLENMKTAVSQKKWAR